MATPNQWWEGARPKTLPASTAPVIVGTAAAYAIDGGNALRAVLALVVSLALQVAVNYANDYSDGVRGTDDERVGPFRLTASKAATPQQVKLAAFAAFGVAAVAGLVLVVLTGEWWLLLVGAAAIAAAWFYTGGEHPYGYAGLGEVFVFVFFGLVAVAGTTYVQAGRVPGISWAGAVGIGAIACALLVTNNLRDVPTDTVAGKNTLAVRLGEQRTRYFYALLLAVALVAGLSVTTTAPWVLITLGAVVPAVPPLRAVLGGAAGRALLPVLRDTGRLELVWAVLFSIGLLVG